jgi:hypothetical protein
MAVQVDQPRRDQLASRVKYPCGSRGFNGGLNRTNLAVTDADIAFT